MNFLHFHRTWWSDVRYDFKMIWWWIKREVREIIKFVDSVEEHILLGYQLEVDMKHQMDQKFNIQIIYKNKIMNLLIVNAPLKILSNWRSYLVFIFLKCCIPGIYITVLNVIITHIHERKSIEWTETIIFIQI